MWPKCFFSFIFCHVYLTLTPEELFIVLHTHRAISCCHAFACVITWAQNVPPCPGYLAKFYLSLEGCNVGPPCPSLSSGLLLYLLHTFIITPYWWKLFIYTSFSSPGCELLEARTRSSIICIPASPDTKASVWPALSNALLSHPELQALPFCGKPNKSEQKHVFLKNKTRGCYVRQPTHWFLIKQHITVWNVGARGPAADLLCWSSRRTHARGPCSNTVLQVSEPCDLDFEQCYREGFLRSQREILVFHLSQGKCSKF